MALVWQLEKNLFCNNGFTKVMTHISQKDKIILVRLWLLIFV
jgi:hypothetical protein